MAQVSIASIVELSDLVTTMWSTKFAALIDKSRRITDMMSKEIVVTTKAARIPFINEWKTLDKIPLNGNPTYETITAEYFTAEIARYAKAVNISLYDWYETNAQSILMDQLDALVAEVGATRMRRIAFLLQNGDTSAVPAYDGVNYFGTHTLPNGFTYTNLLPNNPLDPAGIEAAKNVLRTIPMGPAGSYLPTDGIRFAIIAPSQLEFQAGQWLRSSTVARFNAGTGDLYDANPVYQFAELEVSTYLTDPDDWYMVALYPGISPMVTVRHTTSTGALIPRISDTDLNVLENKQYLWNVDISEETHVVHPYVIVKSTNS